MLALWGGDDHSMTGIKADPPVFCLWRNAIELASALHAAPTIDEKKV